MPDYEAIERKVEADMVRTELKPTPGGWWVKPINGRLEATGGLCCLFSPQVLGERDGIHSTTVLNKLGVGIEWLWAAIDGFDGHTESNEARPGYTFGAEMRRKYVTDPADAQVAADARRESLEDR